MTTINKTNTTTQTPATAEDLLKSVAFALSMARRVSQEIRQEALATRITTRGVRVEQDNRPCVAV